MKALLVKAQKEMRNMETERGQGGNPCPVVSGALAELGPVVMWKAHF